MARPTVMGAPPSLLSRTPGPFWTQLGAGGADRPGPAQHPAVWPVPGVVALMAAVPHGWRFRGLSRYRLVLSCYSSCGCRCRSCYASAIHSPVSWVLGHLKKEHKEGYHSQMDFETLRGNAYQNTIYGLWQGTRELMFSFISAMLMILLQNL